MQRIKQAAIKLVEQSEFKYKMTANAKEQGLQRLGKQEALLKARAAYRQELYMENVQKIASEFQRCGMMWRTGGGRSWMRLWRGRRPR